MIKTMNMKSISMITIMIFIATVFLDLSMHPAFFKYILSRHTYSLDVLSLPADYRKITNL
jgi:hypothetical protein